MLGILFPSLSESKNCKISLGHPDTNVNRFLMGWEFKFNLSCHLNLHNRYWNQVHTKHENLRSILVSKQKQAREKTQLKQGEVFIYLFTVIIFNSKPLFVSVRDRVCK